MVSAILSALALLCVACLFTAALVALVNLLIDRPVLLYGIVFLLLWIILSICFYASGVNLL